MGAGFRRYHRCQPYGAGTGDDDPVTGAHLEDVENGPGCGLESASEGAEQLEGKSLSTTTASTTLWVAKDDWPNDLPATAEPWLSSRGVDPSSAVPVRFRARNVRK
ncbi:hypothetical protein [Rhodococcus sp. ZPP]|uniref:hypothetical protein n=1 Tax=Rhodococcus sp. ZPP TaxID=2749906 RepID=UPI001FCCF136|nr:hypothetical protein [Rhodococcus sp. ZPP]